MPFVMIGSKLYDVYADEADADNYLDAAFHGGAWRSETDDDVKRRALVTAARLLDRQSWLGEKTVDNQALEWPRANTGVDGVGASDVPQAIVDANIELALALVDGSDVQDVQNTSQKLQSIKAGSVSLTYFRGAEGKAVRFPQIVQELIRNLLSGSVKAVRGTSSGTDGNTTTDDDFGFNEGI